MQQLRGNFLILTATLCLVRQLLTSFVATFLVIMQDWSRQSKLVSCSFFSPSFLFTPGRKTKTCMQCVLCHSQQNDFDLKGSSIKVFCGSNGEESKIYFLKITRTLNTLWHVMYSHYVITICCIMIWNILSKLSKDSDSKACFCVCVFYVYCKCLLLDKKQTNKKHN